MERVPEKGVNSWGRRKLIVSCYGNVNAKSAARMCNSTQSNVHRVWTEEGFLDVDSNTLNRYKNQSTSWWIERKIEMEKKEGEKMLERKLKGLIEKELGGKCIKLSADYDNGIPDRLCLFPGGRAMFVEVKSQGETPRKLQLLKHKELRALGFRVDVVDSTAKIENIIEDYAD